MCFIFNDGKTYFSDEIPSFFHLHSEFSSFLTFFFFPFRALLQTKYDTINMENYFILT